MNGWGSQVGKRGLNWLGIIRLAEDITQRMAFFFYLQLYQMGMISITSLSLWTVDSIRVLVSYEKSDAQAIAHRHLTDAQLAPEQDELLPFQNSFCLMSYDMAWNTSLDNLSQQF